MSEKEAAIIFDTAWSPPIQIIEALGDKFPNMHFQLRYLELGDGFAGICETEDNDITDERVTDINSDAFKEMAEYFGEIEWLEGMGLDGSKTDKDPEDPEDLEEIVIHDVTDVKAKRLENYNSYVHLSKDLEPTKEAIRMFRDEYA